MNALLHGWVEWRAFVAFLGSWLLSCGRNVCHMCSGGKSDRRTKAGRQGRVLWPLCIPPLPYRHWQQHTHTASVSISRRLHRCLQTPETTLMPLMRTCVSLVGLRAFIVKAPWGLSHGRGALVLTSAHSVPFDSHGPFSEEKGRPSSLFWDPVQIWRRI